MRSGRSLPTFRWNLHPQLTRIKKRGRKKLQDYKTISFHIAEVNSIHINFLFPWRHESNLDTFEKTYLHDEEIAFLLFDKKVLQLTVPLSKLLYILELLCMSTETETTPGNSVRLQAWPWPSRDLDNGV
jgi:hypothetical protein